MYTVNPVYFVGILFLLIFANPQNLPNFKAHKHFKEYIFVQHTAANLGLFHRLNLYIYPLKMSLFM